MSNKKTNATTGSASTGPSKSSRRRRPSRPRSTRKVPEYLGAMNGRPRGNQRTIEDWLEARGFSDAELFCADPSSPQDLLVFLAKRWRYIDDALLGLIARNPALPMEQMLALARSRPVDVSQNPVFRIRLATEPNFLQSLSNIVRRNLALGRGIDHRLLRELSSSRKHEKSVRRAAASNPTTPVDMLENFLRHAWSVRLGLATNPALPVHLQHTLARDPRVEVRRAIAKRKTVDPEVLAYLAARATDKKVQLNLVANINSSEATIQCLADTRYPSVAREVRSRMEAPSHYLHGPGWLMRHVQDQLEKLNDPYST